MSKTGPIPKYLENEFLCHMMAHQNDDLPDGAWFAVLETAAEDFISEFGLEGHRNDAAHQYLRIAYPDN